VSVSVGREYVPTLCCPDKPGIVYAVSSFLVQHSAHIPASQRHEESPDGRFFMRAHFSVPPLGVRLTEGLQLAELERTSGTAQRPIGQGIGLVRMEAAHA
jgi:formyltetrahydrofolate hydrolase